MDETWTKSRHSPRECDADGDKKKKHAYLKILTNNHREQKNSLLMFVWMPCCVFWGKGISLELQKLLLLVSFFFFFKCPPASISFLLWHLSVTKLQTERPTLRLQGLLEDKGWKKMVCSDNRKSKGFGVYRTPLERLDHTKTETLSLTFIGFVISA